MIFARKLDRYVLWKFLKTLVLAQISLALITTLVHLMDHINVFLDQDAAWADVARYYALQLPYNNLLTLPMSMLIATVLTMGDLGRHGELTAMKASGISLYRTSTPLFAFGLLLSVGVLVVGETVIPPINQRSNVVYDEEILGRQVEYEDYRGSFVYQNPEGFTYIVRSLFVEDSTASADQVEIQRQYDDGTFVRINASQMIWEENVEQWALRNGEVRFFPGLRRGAGAAADTAAAGSDTTGGTAGDTTGAAGGDATETAGGGTTETAGGTTEAPEATDDESAPVDDRSIRERMYAFRILRSAHLDDRPQELLAREKDPEELGYLELEEYIEERERLGAETRQERVDLHMKLAYPFANFVIVLFGVALVGSSAHAGRQSGSAGFGVALFLTIVFWGSGQPGDRLRRRPRAAVGGVAGERGVRVGGAGTPVAGADVEAYHRKSRGLLVQEEGRSDEARSRAETTSASSSSEGGTSPSGARASGSTARHADRAERSAAASHGPPPRVALSRAAIASASRSAGSEESASCAPATRASEASRAAAGPSAGVGRSAGSTAASDSRLRRAASSAPAWAPTAIPHAIASTSSQPASRAVSAATAAGQAAPAAQASAISPASSPATV